MEKVKYGKYEFTFKRNLKGVGKGPENLNRIGEERKRKREESWRALRECPGTIENEKDTQKVGEAGSGRNRREENTCRAELTESTNLQKNPLQSTYRERKDRRKREEKMEGNKTTKYDSQPKRKLTVTQNKEVNPCKNPTETKPTDKGEGKKEERKKKW